VWSHGSLGGPWSVSTGWRLSSVNASPQAKEGFYICFHLQATECLNHSLVLMAHSSNSSCWEAEIKRMMVQGHPGQDVCETPSQLRKGCDGMHLLSQQWQKKKKRPHLQRTKARGLELYLKQ
jgi:hypothetical protein